MAYAQKLMGGDEKIIGIARVHWIYVLQGLVWFLGFAVAGWVMNSFVLRGLYIVTSSLGGKFVPITLLTLNNGLMYFMMVAGFFLFFFMVIKVLFSEVALTTRRVIHKKGLLFVKAQQIDLEEIRGENMDLGYMGRILGYGYIMMDCRFIGDVRLPAIENPEGFIRALHAARAKAQDSLSIVVGKGGHPASVNLVTDSSAAPSSPETEPSTPQTPEIVPPPQEPGPEVNPPATPTELPVPPTQPPPQPAPQEPPPVQPPAPQPPQPLPAPSPSEPPLQPSGTAQGAPAAVDPRLLSQLMRQMAPQMARHVARELVQQGVLEAPAEVQEDTEGLIESFNQARLENLPADKDGKKRYSVH